VGYEKLKRLVAAIRELQERVAELETTLEAAREEET
jgi:outer membrane murein-binding lipoprotein Lpp